MFGFWSDLSVANNEVWRLVSFFAFVLISLIAGKILRIFLLNLADRRVKTAEPAWSDILFRAIAKPVVFIVFAVGLKVGLHVLVMGERIFDMASSAASIINSLAIGYLIYCTVDVIDYLLLNMARRTESKVNDLLAPLVGKAIRIVVAVLVLLNIAVVISGKDMATILTGIGVGGLAIALAGQDTIKNFFGSLVIFGDKPFELGDRIAVEGFDGSVEDVGFRSTKIRTLDGHLVTMPNSEMVNKAVKNISKRPYIKHVANITITYNTPPEKVDKAVLIIRDILEGHEGSHPDFPPRVFFNNFNEWALNILVIYWYHPPEYWRYLEFAERVNMEILRRFNEEGIDFAFPTQTVHLNK